MNSRRHRVPDPFGSAAEMLQIAMSSRCCGWRRRESCRSPREAWKRAEVALYHLSQRGVSLLRTLPPHTAVLAHIQTLTIHVSSLSTPYLPTTDYDQSKRLVQFSFDTDIHTQTISKPQADKGPRLGLTADMETVMIAAMDSDVSSCSLRPSDDNVWTSPTVDARDSVHYVPGLMVFIPQGHQSHQRSPST